LKKIKNLAKTVEEYQKRNKPNYEPTIIVSTVAEHQLIDGNEVFHNILKNISDEDCRILGMTTSKN
jgi:hypothetical protein